MIETINDDVFVIKSDNPQGSPFKEGYIVMIYEQSGSVLLVWGWDDLPPNIDTYYVKLEDIEKIGTL